MKAVTCDFSMRAGLGVHSRSPSFTIDISN